MSATENHDLPGGMHAFLAGCGWDDALVDPIPGDASFRRYFRLSRSSGERAMLMHAPPPHEDPKPFLDVARWLAEHGQRAPAIFADDPEQGWVLTEDFGTDRMRDWIDNNPAGEEAAYAEAVDTLVRLHREPAGPFAPYDMAVCMREVDLFHEWYCPLAGLEVDIDGYRAAWQEDLNPLMDAGAFGVTVLRDYHAENIMLLDPALDGSGAQGLIDFQDALAGHPAYDLVSLLQDARRDVSEALEAQMLERYEAAAMPQGEFRSAYALLGAQRNAKIVGIFSRLYKRDGKPRYLDMIPRVWAAMERDLRHPALATVSQWFDANIPQSVRENLGGELK